MRLALAFILATSMPVMAQCVDADAKEKSRALMLEGLDMALKQKTADLFDNRLKDREHSPERIVRGMRNAILAYTRSRAAVLKWSPQLCETPP